MKTAVQEQILRQKILTRHHHLLFQQRNGPRLETPHPGPRHLRQLRHGATHRRHGHPRRQPRPQLVGQRLRTTPPRGVQPKPVYIPQVSSAGQPGWMWPTRGRVISEYAPNTPGGQSLKIGGSRGQPIYAAHDGEVAYVGSGLSGVGRMIIIRHDDVLAAYGYLDNINVKEHQRVQRGQQIASMGISPQSTPALYFETRKGNRTANPYSYIGSTPRY